MKFNNSVAYSFGSSKKLLNKSDFTPGPGNYSEEFQIVKAKAPGWKIGTSKREESFNSDIPGPGQYSCMSRIARGPKFSFGIKNTKFQDKVLSRDSPGPGNYNPDYKKAYKNISYSMGSKTDLNKSQQLPGPGQYNIFEKMDNTACKFGKEKKGGDHASESSTVVPGPGQYSNSDGFVTKTPKYSFGKDSKNKIINSFIPGPGQYGPQEKIGREGPKYSVGKSSRPLSAIIPGSHQIGPGAYSANFYNKPNVPRTVMGKSKRDQSFHDESPGPGMYVPNKIVKGRKDPAYSLGKSERLINRSYVEPSSLPGPGNYDLKDTVGKGPKFSISGKNERDKPSFVPGPGSYKSDLYYEKIKPKTPSWKIGTSNRQEKSENYVPGPGTYNSKLRRHSTGYKFGRESKNMNKTNSNPGPGQYRIPYSIGEVPNFINGSFSKEFRYI